MTPGSQDCVTCSGTDARQKGLVKILRQSNIHILCSRMAEREDPAEEQKSGHTPTVAVERSRRHGQILQDLPAASLRWPDGLTYVGRGGLQRDPPAVCSAGASRDSEGLRHQSGCSVAQLLHQRLALLAWWGRRPRCGGCGHA